MGAIVVLDKRVDLLDQILHATKGTTTDRPLGDQSGRVDDMLGYRTNRILLAEMNDDERNSRTVNLLS
jgi:hypothetical protein